MSHIPFLIQTSDCLLVIRSTAAVLIRPDGTMRPIVSPLGLAQARLAHACTKSAHGLYLLDAGNRSIAPISHFGTEITATSPPITIPNSIGEPRAIACCNDRLFLITEKSLFAEFMYIVHPDHNSISHLPIDQTSHEPHILLGDTLPFGIRDSLCLWDRILNRYAHMTTEGHLSPAKWLMPDEHIAADDRGSLYLIVHNNKACSVHQLRHNAAPEHVRTLPSLDQSIVSWAVASSGMLSAITNDGCLFTTHPGSQWRHIEIDWPSLYAQGYMGQ